MQNGMNLAPGEAGAKVGPFQWEHSAGLVTLLFTDIVGSTALKAQLGDRLGVTLVQEHHELVRKALQQFPTAEEISTAGDSFLVIFRKPSDGVRFAVNLQARLREFNRDKAVPVQDRAGLHLGEVLIEDRAGKRDVHGMQVDACARVMSLAQPGQILMTRPVFDNARQSLKGEEMEGIGELEWLNYGLYQLKGVEEPAEICEVRSAGGSAMAAPESSEKARRVEAKESEAVPGWRPAVGEAVPNSRWVLERKLGEGGFGEVWLGRHRKLKEPRVFKFCFRADRVRSLKRELTLFRVLKERVADHPNIVRMHDVMVDDPPYYVEMDYVEGSDLGTWCKAQGGEAGIPLPTRLEIVAQAADGLQAAHEAGIIHRDIKPANILIGGKGTGPGEVRVRLTDFGIGQVVSEELLKGITCAGFTQTTIAGHTSSAAGTQLYMAPELLAGKTASTRSDLYSLGVVLYQLLAGDFSRPITTDWAKNVSDPLLREDLELCFAGQPQERWERVEMLAKSIRNLPERRVERRRRELELAARERAAYLRGMVRTGGVAVILLMLITGLTLEAWNQSRRARLEAAQAAHAAAAEKQERQRAEAGEYAAKMNLAQQAWGQNNAGRVRQLLEETASNPERGFEWYYWQQQTHQELRTLRGHLAMVYAVAFTPDGQHLVTGSGDQTARVWVLASGQELLVLKGHRSAVTALACAPDGQRIVTGSGDQTAKVWDAAGGRELFTLKGHTSSINSVAYSADGQHIVTGSDDRTAKVWEAASGRELLTLTGHSDQIWAVAGSPDSRWIAIGSRDGTAQIREAATGRELIAFKGHRGGVTAIAFAPDSQLILTASGDQTAKVWKVADGKELLHLAGHSQAIISAAYSPDGKRIATGSLDQTVKVWEAASGKELFTRKGHSDGIRSVAFSPDSQRMATGSRDQTARVWEVVDGEESLTLKGHSGGISSVAFSPGGQQMATGSYDTTARVWKVASGEEPLILQGHNSWIWSAAFSPDGRWLATGSHDMMARIWGVASGQELLTLKGHSAWIRSVAFSPDGRRLVTGSFDRTAKVWETATGRELLTLEGHRNGISSVAFSPDGLRIITGSRDQTAKVWETAGGREMLTLKGHTAWIWSVAFSPDGRRMATGSEDGMAKTWETASGRELLTFKGHGYAIRSVAFSPGGQRIITGGSDGTAKVWETASGRELLTLKGHQAAISSVAFSPDGQRIMTGGGDGMAKVWKTADGEQVAIWQMEEQSAAGRLGTLRRAQAAATESERTLRLQDAGAIKQWLVLAPLPMAGQSGSAALDLEQIPRERQLRPRSGDRVRVGAGEWVWTAMQLEDYLVDFNQLLGIPSEWSVAFAVCYLHSAANRSGLLLKVGSDDQSRIYLNGQDIYRNALIRSWMPDQDTVAGVELIAGLNVLVFKVLNEEGHWQGSVRFTDAYGQPVKGLQVTLDPEARNWPECVTPK